MDGGGYPSSNGVNAPKKYFKAISRTFFAFNVS